MPTGDITRGTRTALANISRLQSNTNGVAEAFGEVQLSGAVGLSVHMVIPINSSATGGTYDVYVVESQDGAEWTDNVDPNTSGDVASKIADMRPAWSADTTYDATHRTEAEIHFTLNGFDYADYVGFVVDNNSGQTIPASGADGDSATLKVS